jgi:hypothetical protein
VDDAIFHPIKDDSSLCVAAVVAVIKIAQDSTSLDLAKSNKSIEDALEGKMVELTPLCGINSEELIEKLLGSGFSARIVDE